MKGPTLKKMKTMKTMALTVLLIGCTVAAGCVSPESTRVRGGRGADVGNRPKVAKIHDGAEPFWKTPRRITDHPPLESARQAEQLSRQ
jgi:hypothetical protein